MFRWIQEIFFVAFWGMFDLFLRFLKFKTTFRICRDS